MIKIKDPTGRYHHAEYEANIYLGGSLVRTLSSGDRKILVDEAKIWIMNEKEKEEYSEI